MSLIATEKYALELMVLGELPKILILLESSNFKQILPVVFLELKDC